MNPIILVIDDDKVLNEGVSNALRAADFGVMSAFDGESALEMMRIMLPDAIVLDRMMPGMDGMEFLRRVRQRGLKTPVLMLTALGDTENRVAGLEIGADDYMGKPFSVQELILRLKRLTARSAPASPALPGLEWRDDDFFANGAHLPLSDAEKVALRELTSPIGAITQAGAMAIKRLRSKIEGCNLGLTIATIHGKGYKLISK
ncbi:MAG: response regulator transcription factor [Rickettsiales bacterium]|jgi:DNA-binding response OmpR family regulator|nr:response regulator transcription factor [Rickettsiales bacterium]